MGILDNLLLGLNVALAPQNLLYCFGGVFFGTLIGVLPGLGPLAAISMLFPLTFYLEPTTALIMLAGIWDGTSYGGSTTAILLNIPGTPVNAVTALDGYPMSRQGRAGVALFMTTIASFIGGCVGIILLTTLAPVMVSYALRFGSAEYFALILLGLVAASTISSGSTIKSLAMVVLGVMIGVIGMDMYTGALRFTFDQRALFDGIKIAALAMGLFGVAEIIASVRHVGTRRLDMKTVRFRAMKPTRDDVRRSVGPVIRASAIGSFFGALPGVGSAIGAFMSYGLERRLSKEPERFGKGAIEGIMAPETANNAADQTAFIPTLTLGIPGSATMALMLGAMMVHGITPGPRLMTDEPSLFWGLIMSFWIGNVMLLILNIPLIGLWVRVLLIPYHLLFPTVLVFVCIGAYSVNNNPFDIHVVAAFGLLGYLMRMLDFPAAPLLLGFVLGPMLEEHFRRAMVLSQGDLTVLVTRPISASILALTALLLFWSAVSAFRARRAAATGHG